MYGGTAENIERVLRKCCKGLVNVKMTTNNYTWLENLGDFLFISADMLEFSNIG